MILGKIKFHSIYKEINVSGDWDQTKERIILKGGFTEDLMPLLARRFLITDSILKSINNARVST